MTHPEAGVSNNKLEGRNNLRAYLSSSIQESVIAWRSNQDEVVCFRAFEGGTGPPVPTPGVMASK